MAQIERTSKKPAEIIDETPSGYFSTGNVMLNLALTDTHNKGFGIDKITNIIGDSFVGKTLQVKSALAELVHTKRFDAYVPVDDDVEHGTGIDIKKMYGQKLVDRMVAPRYDEDGNPIYSDKIEDFEDALHKWLNGDTPFVYVLDTYDALTVKEEQKLMDENVKIREKIRSSEDSGKESKLKEKESYAQDKNRELNTTLRYAKSKLAQIKSALIVVSQVRENIGASMFEPKLRRNGGKALKHYSWHEIWLIEIEKIKRGPKDRQRIVGSWVRANITKNRSTGKRRSIEFPIYYDYGIDNIEACIEFLVNEGYWKKGAKGKVVSEELGIEGSWPADAGSASRIELVKLIEENNLEKKLYLEAEKAWKEIEESLRIERKPKYEDAE